MSDNLPPFQHHLKNFLDCLPGSEKQEITEAIQLYARAALAQAQSLPDCLVVDRGFRWDGYRQSHFPQLVVEFDPVPFDAPSNSKGWADRDRLAEMLAASPAQPVQPSEHKTLSEAGLTFQQADAAAKVLAERMDYPWSHMPQQGRDKMRDIAQAVIEAAHGIAAPQPKD